MSNMDSFWKDVWKTVKSLFIFTCIAAVILTIAYLVYQYEGQTGNKNQVLAFMTAIIIVENLLTAILFLILLRYVVRYVLQGARQNSNAFGQTFRRRLLGLAFVSLFFPSVIRALIGVPVHFLSVIFSNIFNASEMANMSYSPDDIPRFFFYSLKEQTRIASNAFLDFLNIIPLQDIILALALWVITGQVLDYIFENNSAAGPHYTNRLRNVIKKISYHTRINFLLTLILIFSIYLSFASIIAIPYLHDAELPSELKGDVLQKQLEKTIPTDEEFKRNFIYESDSTKDPFVILAPYLRYNSAALEDEIKQSASIRVPAKLNAYTSASQSRSNSIQTIPLNYKNKWDENLSLIKGKYMMIAERRGMLLRDWATSVDSIKRRLKLMLSDTRNIFETNMLMRLSPQERSRYYKDLSFWFQNRINSYISRLTSTRAALVSFDEALGSFTRQFCSNIENELVRLKSNAPGDTLKYSAIDNLVYYSHTYKNNLDYILASNLDFNTGVSELKLIGYDTPPAVPEPGSGMGIFGWLANWLLRTMSLDFTLITGMLGFGLFGAVISSFIRDDLKKRVPGDPIAKDLISILLRGFSAAIVIFLAIVGGLALFTTSAEKPNPYALFFVCLVGAVFSEDIWRWAHDKMNKNLPGPEEQTGKASASAGNKKTEPPAS